MPHLRCLCEEVVDMLLEHSIGIRHAFVLAQMFQPGFDQEGFQESQFLCSIFEDAPVISAVAAPLL